MSTEVVLSNIQPQEVPLDPRTLSTIHRRLIRQAVIDSSAQALADSINNVKSPEWCFAELKMLLSGSGLTALEEQRALVADMRSMLSIARDNFEDGQKGAGKVYLDTLQMVSKQVDRIQTIADGGETFINSALATLVQEVLSAHKASMILVMAEKYGIDRKELSADFDELMPKAYAEVNARRG